MKIKFTSDTNPKLQGGDFKKGATLECSPASARHWIRRGVAVEVVVVEVPGLKVGRLMMVEKPKKVGRPKKTKEDTGAAPQNLAPSLVKKKEDPGKLPVKGGGGNFGPGLD